MNASGPCSDPTAGPSPAYCHSSCGRSCSRPARRAARTNIPADFHPDLIGAVVVKDQQSEPLVLTSHLAATWQVPKARLWEDALATLSAKPPDVRSFPQPGPRAETLLGNRRGLARRRAHVSAGAGALPTAATRRSRDRGGRQVPAVEVADEDEGFIREIQTRVDELGNERTQLATTLESLNREWPRPWTQR